MSPNVVRAAKDLAHVHVIDGCKIPVSMGHVLVHALRVLGKTRLIVFVSKSAARAAGDVVRLVNAPAGAQGLSKDLLGRIRKERPSAADVERFVEAVITRLGPIPVSTYAGQSGGQVEDPFSNSTAVNASALQEMIPSLIRGPESNPATPEEKLLAIEAKLSSVATDAKDACDAALHAMYMGHPDFQSLDAAARSWIDRYREASKMADQALLDIWNEQPPSIRKKEDFDKYYTRIRYSLGYNNQQVHVDMYKGLQQIITGVRHLVSANNLKPQLTNRVQEFMNHIQNGVILIDTATSSSFLSIWRNDDISTMKREWEKLSPVLKKENKLNMKKFNKHCNNIYFHAGMGLLKFIYERTMSRRMGAREIRNCVSFLRGIAPTRDDTFILF